MATKTQNILIKSNNTDKTKVPASLQHKELAANLLDRSLFGCNGTSVFKYYTGEDKYFNTEGKANISVYAESAEKLKTSRSIFGQPFDGLSDCNGDMNVTGKATIQGDIISGGEVVAVAGEGTPAGVTDYSALTGKPAINGVTLASGNNTLASLGIQAAGDYATNSGVTNLLANYADKTFVSNNYVSKSAFNSHTADTNIHITSAERKAWNAKWDYNEATIKAVKVTAASSADSVAWSGITGKPTTFTPSAHTHYSIVTEGDNRNVATTPNDYINSFVFRGLKDNSTIGSPSSNTYSYVLGLRGWSDSSGGDTHELAFNNSGIFRRQALSSIEWGSWYQLIDTGNFTKSLIEGVLTGDITSHTHSYLPLSGGTLRSANPPLYINRINGYSTIIYQADDVTVGVLGFDQNGTLITRPKFQSNAQYYNVLHSGNYNSYAPTLTGTGASGTWGISISGNAASATKLQTPRTIWGQSFDGIGNVDGGITIRRTWSTGLYNEGIRVVGTSEQWCGIFLGTQDTYSGYQDSQWNILKTDIDTLRIIRGPSYLSFFEIKPNGNVLIGTTTDLNEKLQVNGYAHIGGNILIGHGAIGFNRNTYKGGRYDINYQGWQIDIGGDSLNFFTEGVNYNGQKVIFKPNGNVLIGTITDNGYKLQVNGSERVYGDLIVDGEVSALVA